MKSIIFGIAMLFFFQISNAQNFKTTVSAKLSPSEITNHIVCNQLLRKNKMLIYITSGSSKIESYDWSDARIDYKINNKVAASVIQRFVAVESEYFEDEDVLVKAPAVKLTVNMTKVAVDNAHLMQPGKNSLELTIIPHENKNDVIILNVTLELIEMENVVSDFCGLTNYVALDDEVSKEVCKIFSSSHPNAEIIQIRTGRDGDDWFEMAAVMNKKENMKTNTYTVIFKENGKYWTFTYAAENETINGVYSNPNSINNFDREPKQLGDSCMKSILK